MALARVAKDLSRLLRRHAKVAVLAGLVGAVGWLTVAMRAPRLYTASALIARNQPASQGFGMRGDLATQATREALSVEARQVAARVDWAAMLARYRPSLGAHELSQAAASVASQLTVREVAVPNLGDALQVSYTTSDRDLLAAILTTVIESFTRPISHDPESALRTVQPRPSEEPLYAPVVLPVLRNAQPRRALQRRQRHNARKKQGLLTSALAGELLATGGKSPASPPPYRSQQLEWNTASKTRQTPAQIIPPSLIVPSTGAPALATDRLPNAQEQRLGQDFDRVQREVADLRDSYTVAHPDLATARQTLRNLQLDLRRIGASAVASAKGKARTQMPGTAQAIAAKSDVPDPESTGPAIQDVPATLDYPISDDRHSDFFLARPPTIATRPVAFAAGLLWPLGLIFGFVAALLAAWSAERLEPSIRSESMLRRELPPTAVYLGGIPRVRREVMAE